MIVGFIGFQRVGKTTASNYLIEKYGFVRHNMKDALVAEIKQNFPDLLNAIVENENDINSHLNDVGVKTDDFCFEDLFIKKPPLMRALLQNYGTEVRRGDKDSYWTDQWVNKYAVIHQHVVTDDIRFKNEADTVKAFRQGILIRLTRPDITSGGTHASETEQLEIEADYTIECKPGEHEALYKRLDEIINKHDNN